MSHKPRVFVENNVLLIPKEGVRLPLKFINSVHTDDEGRARSPFVVTFDGLDAQTLVLIAIHESIVEKGLQQDTTEPLQPLPHSPH